MCLKLSIQYLYTVLKLCLLKKFFEADIHWQLRNIKSLFPSTTSGLFWKHQVVFSNNIKNASAAKAAAAQLLCM